MCIIAIKNKGVSMPDEKILKTMFKNNSDGAGFMYAYNGAVHIEKGFMHYNEFKSAIDSLAEKYDISALPLVMHFRIATSGNIDGGTTHPFPVSSKRNALRKLKYTTDLAIAHNGVIPISAPKNMSDTMQYVAKRLTLYRNIQNDFYKHNCFLKRVEKEIKSKMVFLDKSGYIATVGEFITEDNGMIYSNTSYKDKTYFSINSYYDMFAYSTQSKLCPIDGYILDYDGHLKDCDDGLYLIDKYGNLYEYDFNFDVAVRLYADAFTYSGMPCVYDEDKAMYFDVEDYIG